MFPDLYLEHYAILNVISLYRELKYGTANIVETTHHRTRDMTEGRD